MEQEADNRLTEKKVLAYVQRHKLAAPGDKILAGVSGGADSVCLLFMLLRIRQVWDGRLEIEVAHIHHMLRGREADRDMEYVQKLCKEHQLPFHGIYCPVEKTAQEKGMSLEEAGRLLRYQELERLRKERGMNKIAVAHHRDDQTETILMNLFRGSGFRGLAGIAAQRDCIIRPLLSLSRHEIEQYLRERKLAYCTDSTNQENIYTRNKIRNELIPYLQTQINPKVREHIAAVGEDAREIDAYFQKKADNLMEKLVHIEKKQAILYLEQPQAEKMEQMYLFRSCIQALGCGLKDVGRIHLEQIYQLSKKEGMGQLVLPRGILVEKSYQTLIFSVPESRDAKEHVPCTAPVFLDDLEENKPCQYVFGGYAFTIFLRKWKKIEKIPKKKYTKCFDYDKIEDTLQLRTRKPGDYMLINTQGGRKKLKDYFIDEKIPRQERDAAVLLAAGPQILWVVGHRRSEAYRVQEDTKRILVINCEPINIEKE